MKIAQRITIIVRRDGDEVHVDWEAEDEELEYFALATEAMMREVAMRSGEGFERALEMLWDGAMSWRETKGEQDAD